MHKKNPLFSVSPIRLKSPGHLISKKSVPGKMFFYLSLFAATLLTTVRSSAQITFTASNLTQTENFNGMTGNALPTGFTITSKSAGPTSVDVAASSLSSNGTGGSYKFISGSDYAIGFLNSSSYGSPENITATLLNNTGATITSLTITFNYEKYRSGSRAWAWTFFGSTNGSAFTSVPAGDYSYIADGGNTTSTFPPISNSMSVTISGLNIAAGANYYLRWILTGNGGSSNGQGLGIDDVSITAAVQAVATCNAPTGLTATNITSTGANLAWGTVTGASGYQYVVDQNAGNPSGAGTATTSTSFSATSLTPATVYYLHVRTDCGGGSFSSWTTISFTTLTACTPPPATITAAGPTTFCQNDSVVLNANTGTGYTYQWQLNGATINGATNTSFTARNSGSYTVVVATACSTTSTATTVTVNPRPATTVTPATATTFCTGGSVVLNAPTGTGLTYQWSMNGNNINGATNNAYTANAGGSYKVTVTNSNSCSDSSVATIVTVNPLPATTITPASATSFCTGGSVILNAPTGTGLTYQWKLNGSNINGATNNAYTANASGDYKVVVTNGSSCTDSSAATTVTVNPLPTATITPATATTFCNGGSVVLNAPTGTGLTYQWRLNGANITGATNNAYTANASGDYKVVVTNGSNCTDSSAATTVTVNPLPTATITPATTTTFCNGGSVILNAPTGTGLTYQWRMNGANITGATNNAYTANASGNYKVVVTNGSNCTDSSVATTVTVNPLPTATITPATTTTFCNGGSVVLNAPTGTGLTYQWRLNGANITGATNNAYTANASGDYKVVVTNGSNCTDSSAATTVTVNPLPTATITPATATTFCNGGSVVLNAPTGTGLTYQWRLNGANITGATNNAYTANASGNYKVVVSNGSSCTDSSAATTVTVNALPTATITPASATNFCAGGNVVLNAPTGTGLTYQWRLNSANITGATNNTYTANASGNYKVVVSNGSSCTDSSAATTVTVNPLPATTITPASATSFCVGGSVVLNAPTGTGLTYQWRLNSANITGATNNAYITNASGNYKVVVTNGNSCTDSSAATTVTVNALPTATITPASATTFCAGGNVVLNAPTGTGFTYQWRLNGNNVTGATSSAYTANAAGDYKVVITNANSCKDSSVATTIIVNALPTAAITPASSTSFCTGDSVILNAPSVTGLTYQWRRNGNNITSATYGAYTAYTSGNYKVVVTNTNGCSDSSVATTVTANALPVATITPVGATTFCAGNSVVLNATAGTGFTYQWYLAGTSISGATNASYTATLGGAYTIKIVNGNGCSNTSNALQLTQNQVPPIYFTAIGDTTLCANDSVLLAVNTAPGYIYEWKRNGSIIPGATSENYYTQLAGVYSVSINNGGCLAYSPNITVTVNQIATPIITQQAGVGLSTAATYVTYQWKLSDQPIPGATSNTFMPQQSGNYTVTVTDNNGCKTTSAINYFTSLGVPEITNNPDIKMYPNPASTIVHIDAPQQVRVTISSIEGKIVLQENGNQDINISNLTPGIYIVRIMSMDGSLLTTRKLLKSGE